MTELNLINQFLVALPVQVNTYFEDTVTFLVHHGDEGSMGFVINRPTPVRIDDVLIQAELTPNTESDAVILEGGPVSRTSPTIIHTDDFNTEGTFEIANDLFCTSELRDGDIMHFLRALAEGKGPTHYLFFLGYAGWAPQQLEDELETNSWITCPADLQILFNEPYESRFQQIVSDIGIDFDRMGPTSGSA
ncbi:MAG: YqgE/AlgH family protein [Gammaproteobacteria bacterium]|nr:YqgE/AlgH family protein [Gammaproteobacteria bacterium]MDE0251985.1 YqgE/AlgH family protein [Gammaproteobacteria bacterium]MDE0402907.1 YqgE/AlgH family protein [Gammaproteobacteria bacterium]